jgi:hypothetical protein
MALPLAFRGGRLGDGLAFVVVVREEARVYRVD